MLVQYASTYHLHLENMLSLKLIKPCQSLDHNYYLTLVKNSLKSKENLLFCVSRLSSIQIRRKKFHTKLIVLEVIIIPSL